VSLRLTLLWVAALIAIFAVGAPTALATDPADQPSSNPPTPATPTTSEQGSGETQPTDPGGPAQPQALAQTPIVDQAAGAEADAQQQPTDANVPATTDGAAAPPAGQQLVTGPADGAIGQSQQLEQNAQVDQRAESEMTAEQELDNGAQSEASNEAEIDQAAQQEQDAGGAASGQVQQAEQKAEIDQQAEAQALAEQQATSSAPPAATQPDWSAILSQLPWAGGVDEILAIAHNGSLVLQAIWQVQHGCNNHCTGTSQSQSATQNASTNQNATAVADGGAFYEGGASGGGSAPSTAEARNESVTVQFVWQTQIGCVAFCIETSQTQTATQWAQTSQSATADGGASAVAQNLSQTVQLVWQFQEGCREECYGTSQVQVISQGQATTQSAAASSWAGAPTLGGDGAIVLPGWLVALAENLAVTIQTIYQLQEAVCAEYCEGDSQVQDAAQEASVSQEAAARAGGPPADEPPAEEPQAAPPPTAQPPATQPGPATQPAAGSDISAALAAIRDPSSPASRRLRSRLVELAARGRESQIRSLILVLPADTSASPSKPAPIRERALAAPFKPIASDAGRLEPTRSGRVRDSDPPSATTLGVAPQAATDGGSGAWLWIALLAAPLALVPALRRVAR
jgi:hypothetical protein